MTRIAVTGALGRMGTLVIQEAARAGDMDLVAGLDAVGAGKPLLGGVLVRDVSEIREVLSSTRPDVLVDFTVAAAAVENVCTAAELGMDLVVGTTGFSPDQLTRMREAINGRVAVASEALKDYDIEVIEAHHNQKRDAPSGTALATVEVIKKALAAGEAGAEEIEVVHGREGVRLRGREIGVHAVRAGDIVGDHTVLFAGPGERLEIKHQAHSRSALASGAVRAVRWVAVRNRSPGVYSMADVLGPE
jgi:4-hydroxy-tetrahydrodipicolinate reductase